ncbi:V/A-type H+-transporting ATPase subunit A [Limimonas halophila]|uniref:V-type ATP synthase alpha chain n=1 Tax=Limimonas halophila TaxID=1082479 RepID=A0A1G7UAR1_9PROT|nr:V-type ATP synthase subunit A [Limimonas halophila]SDG44666.1 V/A-type H+-transporting ATPase subunit A [Limimonas halophila]
MAEEQPRPRVVAVQDVLVTLEQPEGEAAAPMRKNEVIHVHPRRQEADGEAALKGEILRVNGNRADAQIYESTRGVSVGDPVTQTGEMLSVSLGPGLLGRVFDGLQRPLQGLADTHGTFLPRGVDMPALEPKRRWTFQATVSRGQHVGPGDHLGSVREGTITHRVFAPFDLDGEAEVTWIEEGAFTVDEPIAGLDTGEGQRTVCMSQSWPVRTPLPQQLFKRRRVKRVYPETPLATTIRLIDTFFPVAKGGTACIPGPFGAGKTVLQNLIARYADVDVVVIVACGERAGEVVETLTELPELTDPRTGASLMDRTVIVCNTSSMPVAARESSIYTGLTIGEYYRQMGLDVLVIADSTSRWAQAMRETSGRLEEIPGEEAFPAYLDSTIKAVYERAGVLETPHGEHGSLTLMGTVSPAGGNFEEPVTQSTLASVKAFLGLSSDRAYKRYYPAIDPLISWTRYRDQLRAWYDANMNTGWTERVQRMAKLLGEGEDVRQMMEVTGEEGITLGDYVTYQKARLLDFVYLQQDAFDPVDVSVPLDRQREIFELLHKLLTRGYSFDSKADARETFTRLIQLFTNLNTTERRSHRYGELLEQIEDLANKHAAGSGEESGETEPAEAAS